MRFLLALLIAFLAAPVGVTPADPRAVILATTTSTQDSGLLDVLVPMFERRTGYRVKTIAVGTGQALTMGARGEADVVLVHAPQLERNYLDSGDLVARRLVMHNDFVIVGPAADPAGVKRVRIAIAAMKAIAAKEAPFVSRGDNSGTHAKEKALWSAAAVTVKAPWYLESGQGMGATLAIASERQAYTLTDRATYLAFKKRVDLAILLEGDAPLLNVYHVMEINPNKHPRINVAGGKAFADFIVSAEAQGAISAFGVQTYGQPLFFPDAGKPEPATGSR